MLPDDDTDANRGIETPAPAAAEPLPTVPGYRLVRRLGQGGMAVVYLAVQESLDREVAVKVMAPLASADEAQAQRFEHEARIIAKLEHPGIVGIHEVGRTAEGQLYYVMPYLARGDLSQRDYRDSELRTIDLLRALLDALGYAHARGIVHRDVKAENVLFNNADRPQLTDFGIALSRRPSNARITSDGLALGSGGYMSPEQARGEPVDGRADLYSLGVLAYELLTGELPFHSEDGLALALMHATDPVPALPAEKAHWQRFIETAMAKSPERRFRNAQAMSRALEPLARRLEPPSGLRAMMAHPFWRRPTGLVAAGLLLALGLAAALWPWVRDAGVLPPPAAPRAAVETDDDVVPPEAVEPSSTEVVAAQEQLLADARRHLAEGALIAPAGANAAESYLAVLRTAPAHAGAAEGLQQVLVRLGQQIEAAVEAGRRDSVRERYEEARLLAESAALQDSAGWGALQERTRLALVARIEQRLAAFDRGAALSWASLPGELGLDDDEFRALRAKIAALPEPGAVQRDRGGPELVFVPAQLGRSQQPAPFALMRTEVTRGEYASFAAQSGRAATRCRNRLSPLQLLAKRQWNDPGFEQGGNHPVVCVSFEDARAYAAWMSRRTGQRYRLPTLQEWRHAAQYAAPTAPCAGNVADRSLGGNGAFDCSDGQRHTGPVRRYGADRLAAFDLVGNAAEWTLACGEAGNPLARLLEQERCARRSAAGMSWRDGPGAPPGSHQQLLEPDRGYDDVGFRLLREISPAGS
jgi:serine/threonine-protein kinase PpkA